MAWSYTKTFGVLCLAQFAIRIPLSFLIDAHPLVAGGQIAAGLALVVMLLPLGIIIDLCSGVSRAVRSRLAS